MKLAVAEEFYSIQGEGRYAGVPAHFLRLAGCNLLCGGFGTERDKRLHDGASWRCDTIEVWRKGRAVDVTTLIEKWSSGGVLESFTKGAHLIITGGEPMLQQDSVDVLLKTLAERFDHRFVEIETNGTIASRLDDSLIINWNCSPKLKNSGMDLERRKIRLLPSDNLDFKFVISGEADIEEVLDIQAQHEIDSAHVFLMPATDERQTLLARSRFVAEQCLKYKFNFSSRHQVMIWDRTTGV